MCDVLVLVIPEKPIAFRQGALYNTPCSFSKEIFGVSAGNSEKRLQETQASGPQARQGASATQNACALTEREAK